VAHEQVERVRAAGLGEGLHRGETEAPNALPAPRTDDVQPGEERVPPAELEVQPKVTTA